MFSFILQKRREANSSRQLIDLKSIIKARVMLETAGVRGSVNKKMRDRKLSAKKLEKSNERG